MNLFETAAREAYRFPSIKGELNVEQLWQLPLQSKTQFDLDTVAKAVNAQLKAVTEDSFVASTPPPGKTSLTNKLDIVKHIIAARLEENERARQSLARKAQREKLLDVLAKKQDQALDGLTMEELTAQINALT